MKKINLTKQGDSIDLLEHTCFITIVLSMIDSCWYKSFYYFNNALVIKEVFLDARCECVPCRYFADHSSDNEDRHEIQTFSG